MAKLFADETEVDRLFPLQDIPPLSIIPEVPQEEIEERVKRVLSSMKSVSPQSDPDGVDSGTKRLGYNYRCFKDVDELKGVTKRLYEVAAEVAGLSLRDLL